MSLASTERLHSCGEFAHAKWTCPTLFVQGGKANIELCVAPQLPHVDKRGRRENISNEKKIIILMSCFHQALPYCLPFPAFTVHPKVMQSMYLNLHVSDFVSSLVCVFFYCNMALTVCYRLHVYLRAYLLAYLFSINADLFFVFI